LLEFDEEFELEEEELEEEEPDEADPEDELEPECGDDPEPSPEPEDDEPALWSELCCEDPEPPALRVGPASGSLRWLFPPPSCFGGGL
jgi:hypothetical protein